jgi:hypothetical protein
MSRKRKPEAESPRSWCVRVRRTVLVEFIAEGTREQAQALTFAEPISGETVLETIDEEVLSCKPNE